MNRKAELKKLIKCMEKGWKLLPANPTNGTNGDGRTNACPLIHAVIGYVGSYHYGQYDIDCVHYGRYTITRAESLFPILTKQMVDDVRITQYCSKTSDLVDAIITLADRYCWTTLEVIEWLRTHQED